MLRKRACVSRSRMRNIAAAGREEVTDMAGTNSEKCQSTLDNGKAKEATPGNEKEHDTQRRLALDVRCAAASAEPRLANNNNPERRLSS